jgi:hypothetical protein
MSRIVQAKAMAAEIFNTGTSVAGGSKTQPWLRRSIGREERPAMVRKTLPKPIKWARGSSLVGLSKPFTGRSAPLHQSTREDTSQLVPDGGGTDMRSEIETVVEDIKRSVGLLRRHL